MARDAADCEPLDGHQRGPTEFEPRRDPASASPMGVWAVESVRMRTTVLLRSAMPTPLHIAALRDDVHPMLTAPRLTGYHTRAEP